MPGGGCMMEEMRPAIGKLNDLKIAILAVACLLCLITPACGFDYAVTLVDYKGKLRNIDFDRSLWQKLQDTWGPFLKDVSDRPSAYVTAAKRGTLTKGEFSRQVVRLTCTSIDQAARLVKGHNGSIVRGDRREIGFVRIEKEITFFENPLVAKEVEIEGYRGIMAEVAAFTAWFMVRHNEWKDFVDQQACPSMGHQEWKYATAGILTKEGRQVSYVCVRPWAPAEATECLRNTERLYGDPDSGYVLVSHVGDKLLFLGGKSTNKDMWALKEAIPKVQGFDPD
jgi:hypothetical protein